MDRVFNNQRPEIDRPGSTSEHPSEVRPPRTICAITYLSRPQNLPPFYNAAQSLTRSGFRVHGYGTLGKVGNLPIEEITPGFTFSRIGINSRSFFLRLPGKLGNNFLTAGLQYLFSFAEYNVKMFFKARKCQADLVEAHDLPSLLCALLVAKLRHRPLVYHAHELWSEMGTHIRFKGFWRWFEKRLIGGVDLIVVPEENRARIYRDEYGARDLPLVVANCPPFKETHAGTALADLFASRGTRVSCMVLYQGVISSERCVDEIVAAAAHFRDGVALALIGQGFGEWADPQSRMPSGGRVLYQPHVPYEKLLDYTASAHIGLLFYRNTCRNNYYCAPNKLYEYMMMGLPVITPNYPGLVGFVEGQNIGICVDPEDPRAIADAVNRIAGDETLRQTMRENCLRLARDRWNFESEFTRLHAAYAALPHAVTSLAAVAPAAIVPIA